MRPSGLQVGIVHLGIGAFHRAHQARLHRRRARARRRRVGHLRSQPALGRRPRPDAAPGRPVHVGRNEPGRRAPARHRQRARSPVPGRSTRRRASPARCARDADRHADRDRKGLLPRTGDRRARPRASGHRPRSRAARRVAQRRGPADLGAGGAPGHARRATDGRLLRQPAAQRCAAARAGRRVRARRAILRSPTGSRARSRSRRRWSIASCRRRPPTDIARERCGARTRGPGAGRPRAVHAMGDRGRFRHRAAGVGAGGRDVRRRRRAVRVDEAAPAERAATRPSRISDSSRATISSTRSRRSPISSR